MTEADRDPYLIGSLRKGLEVIDCFAQRESWSLTELTGHLGLNKATVFRILHTLQESGYLAKDEDTGRYRLGMRFYSLGTTAVRHEQLKWQALPPLMDLAESTGETVYVGILYEGDAVCVQIVDGTELVRMHSFVGKRSPAHASALGKVLLAHMPDAEVDAYAATYGLKRLTDNTITDPARFREELRRIREQGYALDAEEMTPGLRCIGAPITDHTGRPFATISLSAPADRMTPERIVALVPRIKAAAFDISRMLGSPGLHRRTSGSAA
ncbi:IclR family transcriptional regulator [Thalassobaculum sp.]|uniref:IclR family transcriptional regulator n=1 Tax=Thalassobaculum sp. TaxID=2022740 RepID=UPI0032ECDBF5